MAMGRTLYPHKKLPDAVYALLAKDLDGKADAALQAGIQALDHKPLAAASSKPTRPNSCKWSRPSKAHP